MATRAAKPRRFRVRVRNAAVSAAERARLTALRWRGFTSRYVETDQGHVHVLEGGPSEGKAPPLVLLHGLSSCGTDYGPMLRHLRQRGRRLLLPDLPGHGLSSAIEGGGGFDEARESLGQALDQILDRPAVVFGNSLGGFASIRYANRSPDRVQKLILSSPGGAPMSDTELGELLGNFRALDRADARAFIERVTARPHWSHAILAWGMRARFDQPGVKDLLRLARSEDLLQPEELATLSMPVLLLWGLEERLFGDREYAFFRDNLPGHAVVERPERFGHAPFLDRPRALATRIEQFAAG